MVYTDDGENLNFWGGANESNDGFTMFNVEKQTIVWSYDLDQPSDQIAFSPDKQKFAIIGSENDKIFVCEWKTGEIVKQTKCKLNEHYLTHMATVSDSENSVFVSKVDKVYEIDLNSGNVLFEAEVHCYESWINKDNQFTAIGADEDHHMVITKGFTEALTLPINIHSGYNIGVSPNKRYITFTWDHSVEKEPWPITIFDMEGQKMIWEYVDTDFIKRPVHSVIHPELQFLAVEYEDDLRILFPKKN
ncbi:MAG: hypothetical protein QNL04_09495 [SAR324 cluster bacterium]|nr:hypothetical protein [SAR324 cluster bacterium]